MTGIRKANLITLWNPVPGSFHIDTVYVITTPGFHPTLFDEGMGLWVLLWDLQLYVLSDG